MNTRSPRSLYRILVSNLIRFGTLASSFLHSRAPSLPASHLPNPRPTSQNCFHCQRQRIRSEFFVCDDQVTLTRKRPAGMWTLNADSGGAAIAALATLLEFNCSTDFAALHGIVEIASQANLFGVYKAWVGD